MIGIKCLRLTLVKPRVCQPARNTDHRSASNFDQGRTVI